jgi:hypothetical protein
VTRDDDPVGGKVEAPIPLVVGRVADEHAERGTRSEFVSGSGGKVRIASTPERT